MTILTRRVSFEVARLYLGANVFRGEAPDVYLAQPNGLGPRKPINGRAFGPKSV